MELFKLNTLSDNAGARKKSKRLGRGIGSGKGKTCGRGVKGQKARSGVAIKSFEGGQMPLIKRLPKRGFNSLSQTKSVIINIDTIQKLVDRSIINSADIITKELLIKSGVLKKSYAGQIKLLSKGNLNTALSFDLDNYSEEARVKILATNGTIAEKKV